MAVLEIEYVCIDCGKTPPEDYLRMVCPHCRGRIRGEGPGITGTRDNFGIKNEFRNEDNKVIDNWTSWEKEGYRKPLETHKEHHVKEKIKDKIGKINHKNK